MHPPRQRAGGRTVCSYSPAPLISAKGAARVQSLLAEKCLEDGHTSKLPGSGQGVHSLPSLGTTEPVPQMEKFSRIKTMWEMEDEVTAEPTIRSNKMRFLLRCAKNNGVPTNCQHGLRHPGKPLFGNHSKSG